MKKYILLIILLLFSVNLSAQNWRKSTWGLSVPWATYTSTKVTITVDTLAASTFIVTTVSLTEVSAGSGIYADTDSDSIIVNPAGFDATNSAAVGNLAWQYKDGATSLAVVDTSGNVGIGTASIAAGLQIGTGTPTYPVTNTGIYIIGVSEFDSDVYYKKWAYYYTGLQLFDNDIFYMGSAGDAKMWYNGSDLYINPRNLGSGNLILYAGNMGINTTAPLGKLHVEDADTLVFDFGVDVVHSTYAAYEDTSAILFEKNASLGYPILNIISHVGESIQLYYDAYYGTISSASNLRIISPNIYIEGLMRPFSDSAYDFGKSNVRWSKGYFSGVGFYISDEAAIAGLDSSVVIDVYSGSGRLNLLNSTGEPARLMGVQPNTVTIPAGVGGWWINATHDTMFYKASNDSLYYVKLTKIVGGGH